jgi:hypothetical protein
MLRTYRQLSGPVQALNLVDSITDAVQQLAKTFSLYDLARSLQYKHRVRTDVVIDLAVIFRQKLDITEYVV